MGNEVKRYNTTLLGTDMPPCAVSASDYDALHAEAEALRAENGRLNREADESLAALVNQRDTARTELEAARGLLREAAEDVESWGAYASAYFQEKHDLAGCAMKYRIAGTGDQGDGGAEQAAIAAMPLTATPAPEVRCPTCDGTGDVHRADGEWLGECHCVKTEHAERQEAVGHVALGSHTGVVFYSHMPQLPDGAKLYAAPPAQDVSGLVEALEKLACLGNGDRPGNSDGNLIAQAALAAYRKESGA